MSRKTYQPFHPEQSELLPMSPRDWLPSNHMAFFVLDVVKELDLREIFSRYERSLRGHPPHHPQMLVGLLLYGYATGVTSSRRLERRAYEDVAFRVLAGGARPDHTTISEFRRVHLKPLSALFVQVLRLCQKAGLVRLGQVALDGTKVKANASKHKAMSYERMHLKEAELATKVSALMAEAERFDREEDAKYGKGKRGDELPEELARTQTRLARIREAKAALEAEAAEQRAREEASKRDDDDTSGPGATAALPQHRVPQTSKGTPKPKAQRNFTDPESRLQKTNDGFVQGYNCQTVVDAHAQIIVAQAVTNQPPDVEHFVPMLELVKTNCDEFPRVITADAGYSSEANAAKASALGVDAYIALGRQKHGMPLVAPDLLEPKYLETERQRMAHKLATDEGRRIYARRKAIVEPVFGQIKHARGFRQFMMRGIDNVRGEWALIAAAHNLLKLFRAVAIA